MSRCGETNTQPFRLSGYRDNCELSDREDWDLIDRDFDRDQDWDFFVREGDGGRGGREAGDCLDGGSGVMSAHRPDILQA